MQQSSSPIRKDNIKIRQTMFEFLKRKKHIQLENSLKLNNQHHRAQYKSNRKQISNSKQRKQKNDQQINLDDTIGNYSISHRNGYTQQNYHSNITPKKILFSQNYQTIDNNKSSRKPLIQMISPLKNQVYNRLSYNHNTQSNKQKNQSLKKYQIQTENTKRILKTTNNESFNKKKLYGSLNTLKNVFLSMFQAGKTVKQKSTYLSISLVNFVKDLNLSDKIYSKKLGQIRLILKSIESLLENFNDNNEAQQLIQQLNLNLSQHLNSIESINNQTYEKQLIRKTQQIQKQKNEQIYNIQNQNQKLNRQLERYQKRIQKLQSQMQKYKQNNQDKYKYMIQNIQNNKGQYQTKQTKYKQQIQQLKQLLKQQIQKCKSIQKKLKNYIYSQQKLLKQTQQKKIQQQSARQNYLLQQIQKLKQQFANDISKLHLLYKTKIDQNQNKFNLLQNIIQRQKNQRTSDKSVSNKILEQANIHKNQIIKVSKKNQQILRDLYRMNEQLYQHWLALKDIKTLSERLHVFQHFQRIFKDLVFNPNLFQY